MSQYSDDYIMEYLANHPTGDDPFSDGANYPYIFLQGYRDAEAQRAETLDKTWSMAEAAAYRLGRFEFTNQ